MDPLAETVAGQRSAFAVGSRPQDAGRILDGRYRLDRLVGRGAFAAVHEATDLRLSRSVAVKMLHAGRDVERFRREAAALARLDHPAIVRVHDAGLEGDEPYLVLDLVEGTSLESRLVDGPVPWDEAVRIGVDLASALDHAHDHGVLHRDVKPANVLIAHDGAVKVTDFGVAKVRDMTSLTDDDSILGTASYVAPELFRGQRPDASSDTWSLGVVLYRCVTGRLPFAAETMEELVTRVLEARTKPPRSLRRDLPERFDELVMRCLARNPADRPASCREVRLELERMLDVGVERTHDVDVPVRLALASFPPGSEDQRAVVLLRVEERHLADIEETELPRRLAWNEAFEVVERDGAKVAAIDDEGAWLACGVPAAHERDDDRALSCAIDLLERLHDVDLGGVRLRLAVAVEVGRLERAPDGAAWCIAPASENAIRRLAAEAPDGELRAGPDLVERSRDRARFQPAEDVVGATSEGFRLCGLKRRGPRREETPLLGRTAELDLVVARVGGAARGRGVIVTVEGPAGIGKTRLVREVERRLADTFRIASVEVRDFGGRPTFRVFRDLWRALDLARRPEELSPEVLTEEQARVVAEQLGEPQALGDSPTRLVDPDERSDVLRDAWLRLLAAASEERPLALLVEDLHWADEASCRLLADVAMALPGLPVALVGTHRPDWRGEWTGRPFHHPVTLGPLAEEDEEALLRNALGVEHLSSSLREHLTRHAAGNPLYALELARALARDVHALPIVGATDEVDVPPSLHGILQASVDRLQGGARRVLEAAAVIGRRAPVALLDEVVDEPTSGESLEDLLRSGLLVERWTRVGPAVQFHHALLREVVHEGLSGARRCELHGRVARALQDGQDGQDGAGVGAVEPSVLGLHLAEGPSPGEAVPLLRDAATRALDEERFGEALEWSRRALRCLEATREDSGADAQAPSEQHVDLALLVAAASRKVESGSERRAAAESALRLAEALGGDARTALGLKLLAQTLHHEDRARMLAAYARAEELADRAGDQRLWWDVRLRRIMSLDFTGLLDEADELLAEIETETPPDDSLELNHFEARVQVAYSRGDLAAAERALDEALALVGRRGLQHRMRGLLSFRTTVLSASGRYEEAIVACEELLANHQEFGEQRQVAHVLSTLGLVLLLLGRLEDSARRLSEAATLASRFEVHAVETLVSGALSHLARLRGDVWGGWAHAIDAVRHARHGGEDLCDARAVAVTMLLELGELHRARRLGERFARQCRAASHPFAEVLIRATVLLADALGGARDDAVDGLHRRAREIRELVDACDEPDTAVFALVNVARALARAEEDVGAAESLATRVRGRAESLGMMPALALAEIACAEAAPPGAERGREAAERAVAITTSLGLAGVEWEARSALARHLGGEQAARERASAAALLRKAAGTLPPERRATFLARPDRAALLNAAPDRD